MEDTFFALLRSALWGAGEELPASLTSSELGEIMRMAEEQAVVGLVVDAIIQNNISIGKSAPIKLFALSRQIKTANVSLNKEIAEFVRLMASNNVEYYIVKGQTAAALYRNPYVRMSGDIDFCTKNYGKASDIINKEWNAKLPERLIEKEASFAHNGALYEIHRTLVEFGSKRHQRYWEQLMETSPDFIEVDDAQVKTLEPTLYAVYVFLHLFFHFIHEGVGLRQLCDWAIVLYVWKNRIDKNKLQEILQELGMEKAYCAFGYILIEKLKLEYFPLAISVKDIETSHKILKDIMRVGNFGKYGRKDKKGKWNYKLESMWLAVKNSFKYYSLAPKEVSLMFPRLMKINLKLIAKKQTNKKHQ